MNGQLPTVIICGATGVGKTDFSLALAQKVDAEIINADMGQFYAPLTIGTAKPDWRALPSVHHAFDIIDEPKDFTSASYRKLVSSMIHEVHSRGRIPLIVGGSTLYISSLFFPPTSKAASTVLKTTLPDDQLWNYLYRIDPDRAKHIHPRDIYRIKRALTIWETTHKKPSAFRVQFDPVAQPFILIILLRDRDDLYTRINHRVRSMIDQGWIEEVKALISGPWVPFLLKKKTDWI